MPETVKNAPVKLTIDGHAIEAAPGTLLIDAAKHAGIEIPAFCYYEGYSLQAACRMCLVEVEKTNKLQVACTVPVAEGMVVHTDSKTVASARKGTLEFLLTNHPLDCPVCDKGGECELQDMVFRYGAGESRFLETKHHVDEKQWSPVVYFDGPRCILCYRCVRACNEGMGVGALGVINRGVLAEIGPNMGDHLECDECGACIDICPVGALTSGIYRYQTRPWEMDHVGTICTHCSNGCKTTLGVRNDQIIRGNNRDRSGINDEFLCVKGRYGFDFVEHPERLQSPMKKIDGRFEPISWSDALTEIGARFRSIVASEGDSAVIGGTHATNEENFYLQKFARKILGTNNIDHRRTGDLITLLDVLSGKTDALATTADLYNTRAALIIGSDLSQQHPLLAFQLRASTRHHAARLYTVTAGPVREDKYSTAHVRAEAGKELEGVQSLRDKLASETSLVIIYSDAIKGENVRKLVSFGDSLGIPIKYICLVDDSNSRGALDMGVAPDLGPGYHAVTEPGMSYQEILDTSGLDLLWIIGENPYVNQAFHAPKFMVVQDMFMTETAKLADIVLPSASAYEKTGTVTNVCGEVQRLKRAAKVMGTKSDLEILGLIGKEMGAGVTKTLGIWTPEKVFDEIRSTVNGYNVPLPVLSSGAAAQTSPVNGRVKSTVKPEAIQSANNTLFTSGSLGKYSKLLNSLMEAPGALYK